MRAFWRRRSSVSLDWLRNHDRTAHREGWTEAPRVNWKRVDFSGTPRKPLLKVVGGRFL
jgi:hypothetical protein